MRAGELFNIIRALVREGKYVVGEHATERLGERNILEWQAVVGLEDGDLLSERHNDLPNPSVEVQQMLSDGTPVKAVWSHLARSGVAKLVTIHFID